MTVLRAGPRQLALHRLGPQFRANDVVGSPSNAKPVFTIDDSPEALRVELVAAGARMRDTVTDEADAFQLVTR